jgi:hypothetical protein
MVSCLGIYVNENILRYAKLTKNNNNIEINDHGIKFVRNDIKEMINNIINETNSKDIPVVLNGYNVEYAQFQIFKQIPTNAIYNATNIEFEEWCEKYGKGPTNYSYVYNIAENLTGEYYKGNLAIVEKSYLDTFNLNNVANIYPQEMLVNNVVPSDEKDYVLVDLSEVLSVTTVIEGKVKNTNFYNVGMKQIFEKFTDILGSYQKSYEACKEFNVFSDETEGNNKVQLEEIAEPILQEVLHNVAIEINKDKESIKKIILTGTGTLFTNLDTLFTEYTGVRCEILKPTFVTDLAGVRNIAETLETLSAAILAYEYLVPKSTNLGFLTKKKIGKGLIDKLFGKKIKEGTVKKEKTNINLPKFNKPDSNIVLALGLNFIIVMFLVIIRIFYI